MERFFALGNIHPEESSEDIFLLDIHINLIYYEYIKLICMSEEIEMIKENKTVYVILGFLNHEDLTGYEIKKRIDGSLSYFWGAGFGQIYPALKLMEKNSWVEKRSEISEKKHESIVYTITEEGKTQLTNWLSATVENEYVKYEILLKVFFGSMQKPQKNIDNIEKFKNKYEGHIAILEGYEENLQKNINSSPDHLYYLLTVLFGRKVFKAYTEWAEEAIELIKKSKKNMEDK